MLKKKIILSISLIILLTSILTQFHFRSLTMVYLLPPEVTINLQASDQSVKVAEKHLSSNLNLLSVSYTYLSCSAIDAVKTTSSRSILVIIGHGLPQGLATSDGILSWETLHQHIERSKQPTIILSCYSSLADQSSSYIMGFEGGVNAIAASSIALWTIECTLKSKISQEINSQIDEVIRAQNLVKYPLEGFLVPIAFIYPTKAETSAAFSRCYTQLSESEWNIPPGSAIIAPEPQTGGYYGMIFASPPAGIFMDSCDVHLTFWYQNDNGEDLHWRELNTFFTTRLKVILLIK